MADLQEAAERSIAWFNGLVRLRPDDAIWVQHFKNLRDAHLDDHAIDDDDDKVPWSLSWLESVGFQIHNDDPVVQAEMSILSTMSIEARCGVLFLSGNKLPHVNKRGEVRLLFKGLGIKLKEPTNA